MDSPSSPSQRRYNVKNTVGTLLSSRTRVATQLHHAGYIVVVGISNGREQAAHTDQNKLTRLYRGTTQIGKARIWLMLLKLRCSLGIRHIWPMDLAPESVLPYSCIQDDPVLRSIAALSDMT